jgi:hypothetical protein
MSEIDDQIAKRRNDPEFMARLKARVDQEPPLAQQVGTAMKFIDLTARSAAKPCCSNKSVTDWAATMERPQEAACGSCGAIWALEWNPRETRNFWMRTGRRLTQ